MGDLVEAVASGDVPEALAALRDHLAVALAEAEPRYKAPLAKQLQDVIARLEAVPVVTGSRLDELTARRAARGAATSLKVAAGGEPSGGGRGRRAGGARRAGS